jgi:hypothetical protein
MKQLSRLDGNRGDEGDDDDSNMPSIPRFLGRQSNQ